MGRTVAGGRANGNGGGRARRTHEDVRRVRGGAAGGVSSARGGRRGGGKRTEARQVGGTVGVGGRDCGGYGRAGDGIVVALASSANDAGGRTLHGREVGGMARAKRCAPADTWPRNPTKNTETRRVVHEGSHQHGGGM